MSLTPRAEFSQPPVAANLPANLAASPPEPLMRIRPNANWRAIHLRELWRFRDLTLALAGRDLRLRYKQTVLGAAWVVLQPLLAAGLFTFVFGMVAKMPSDGLPYFLFSYAGLLGWNLFFNTLTKTSGCLVGNSHLISKVFFPRLILPLSTIPSSLVDFAIGTGDDGGVDDDLPRQAGAGRCQLLPVWMLLLMLLSLGIGLMMAALAVSYRDITYIVPVVLQLLMYASPIAYATSKVPLRFQTWYNLNPLAPILDAFRWSLLRAGQLAPGFLALAATVSVIVFFVGLYSFQAMEKKFADVI